MASVRMYLRNQAASYVPATIRGAWDLTAGSITRELDNRKSGSGIAATQIASDINVAANYDVLWGRWISAPASSTGSLSGTWSAVIGVVENLAAADAVVHVHAFWTVGDSDVVRGVAISDYIHGTEIPTTAAGQALSGALSTVAVTAGDHLVVEIGARFGNAVTTAYSATLNYGIEAVTDLTAGDTNVTTRPGWIEFSTGDDLFTPTISVDTIDTYPPRNVVSVTGIIPGDFVTVERRVGNDYTTLRGADQAQSPDYSFLVTDSEFPFGVPVSYRATVESLYVGASLATDSDTYELTGGKVALSDAITGNAAEVVITAWPTRTRTRQASTFIVNGRNVVVAGPLGQGTSEVEVYTETDTARDNLLELLETATAGVIQIRQAGPYSGVDCYVAVLAVDENRWSQDGTDQRRTWTLSVTEVEPWSDAYETRGTTLQDIGDAYFGLTLADLGGDYGSLLDLAQGDFS